MDTNNISTKIKEDFDRSHLAEIKKFIRQPSVSADGNGIVETATMLSDKIKKLGGKDVHLVDLSGDDFGHPIVYGEIFNDAAKTTILFYSMYDVQPVFPENWIYNDQKIDPFGAEIIDYEWIPGYSGECLMETPSLRKLLFISYMPKFFADIYIKHARNLDEYDVYLPTYWGMKNLLSVFDNVVNITPYIVKNPDYFNIDPDGLFAAENGGKLADPLLGEGGIGIFDIGALFQDHKL